MRDAHRIGTVVNYRGPAIVVALLLFSAGAACVHGAEPPAAPPNDARVEGVPSVDRGTRADFPALVDRALGRETLPPFRRQDGAMVCDAAGRVPRARTQALTCEAPPTGAGPWGPVSPAADVDLSRPTNSRSLASSSGLRGDSVVGAGAPMVPPIAGPPTWRRILDPSTPEGPIEGQHLVYDAARGRIFYSDQDLYVDNGPFSLRRGRAWEWDGRVWAQLDNFDSTYSTAPGGMVYDAARERVVKIGCETVYDANWLLRSFVTPRTWEWDGRAWTERTPPTSFTPHENSAFAYDEARGRVVLFGGSIGDGYYGPLVIAETWEWDGYTWTRKMPPTSPPARVAPAMAYDRARQRVVMFGGWDGNVLFGDTWEWDGDTWVELVPEVSPDARAGGAMAYSDAAQRVVLFGGGAHFAYLGDTWEWDGATWVQRFSSDIPPARRGAGLAYDAGRERLVLFGGWDWDENFRISDTWEWDGNAWLNVTPPARPAQNLGDRGIAFDSDRGRAVLIDVGKDPEAACCFTQVWERDGGAWYVQPTDIHPSSGNPPCVAYDAARHRVVYFRRDSPSVAETWEWDGSSWEQFTPAVSPPTCDSPMVFHEARGRVVVVSPPPPSPSPGDRGPADIWEWDGVTWSSIPVPSRPPGRLGPSLAYDSGRNRLVLFGGRRCVMVFGACDWQTTDDTWEWDGDVWELRAPPVRPPARAGGGMVYDAARARVVLSAGGMNNPPDPPQPARDTWEWDGDTWVETTTSPRFLIPRAYDSIREQILAFDKTATTWAYGPIDPCAYAVEATTFSPGGGTDSASGVGAIAAPDGQAVALGVEGTVVLRMSPPIEDQDGTDLIVYERGARDGEVDERFWVEVSADNNTFEFAQDCGGGECLVDLLRSRLGQAAYVRITDVGPQEAGTEPPLLGADIDALSALHCAETCNGLDDNRDGSIPSDELDGDNDHYVPCQPWSGADPAVQSGGDCDDGNAAIHPGVQEICNGIDDDCNGVIDNGGDVLCDDGNACTMTDVCADGACVGTEPVVCTALDQCHVPGACDPRTGVCSNPALPDGAACDDHDLCTTGDTCFAGVCTSAHSGLEGPNPRTNGYYKRLCHGPHSGDQLTDADAACVARIAATFVETSTVAEVCAVIEPSRPNGDACGRAEDDLMVLALNLCRARVCAAQPIDSQCGANSSVGQSLAESDAILASSSRDFDTCAHAKCLDEEINTGRALELNSLRLRLEAGGVRLDWTPPYLNDGSTAPSKYSVWRRERGSFVPFTRIGETVNTRFLDTTSGDAAFEYEVTPAMN